MNKKKSVIKRPENVTPQFLLPIHYFRAFAIICIFIVHTWTYPESETNSYSARLLVAIKESVFHSSTIYFIFISGFLFHHLSGRFELRRFFTKKVKNIIIPYLVLSIGMVAFYTFLGKSHDFSISNFLAGLPRTLALGKAQGPYWYIPFIMVVFLISPLLLKLPERFFKKYVPYLFFLPLLGTRTGVDITIYQYLYFSPIYLLGIYTSLYYDETLELARKYKLILIPLVFIATGIIFYLRFQYRYEDNVNLVHALDYVRSFSVTFLILLFLKRWEDKSIPLLKNLATYSFPIYFLHDFLFYRQLEFYHTIGSYIPKVFAIPFSIGYNIILLLLTLLFCMFIKKVFKKYSRYLIGI